MTAPIRGPVSGWIPMAGADEEDIQNFDAAALKFCVAGDRWNGVQEEVEGLSCKK